MANVFYCRKLLTERPIRPETPSTKCCGSKKAIKLFNFFEEADFEEISVLIESAYVEIINNEGNITEISSETTDSRKSKHKKSSFFYHPQYPQKEIISFSKIANIRQEPSKEYEKPVISLEIENSKKILLQLASDTECDKLLTLLQTNLKEWRSVQPYLGVSAFSEERFQEILDETCSVIQVSSKNTVVFSNFKGKKINSFHFSTKETVEKLDVVWKVRESVYEHTFEVNKAITRYTTKFKVYERQCELSFELKLENENNERATAAVSNRTTATVMYKQVIVSTWLLVVLNYFLQAEFNTWTAPHNICFQVAFSSLFILLAVGFTWFYSSSSSTTAVVPTAIFSYAVSKISVKVVEEKGKGQEVRVEDLRGIEGLLEALDQKHTDKTSINDLPFNWIEGCDFDRKQALERWNESLTWRKENKIDAILTETQLKQKDFFQLKQIWNQSFLGVGKDEKLVTLERFKGLDKMCKEMRRKEIAPEVFRDYCIFQNEFWIKRRLSPAGKLIKIVDVDGLTVGLNLSLILRYFGRMNKAMQQYPEIMGVMYFVNVEKAGAPFRILFKLLPNFVDQRTMKKLHQIRLDDPQSVEKLRGLVDPKKLPKDLGGDYEGDVYDLPFEKQMAEHVRKVLE